MMIASPTADDVERLQARIDALEQEKRHLLAVVEILQEIARMGGAAGGPAGAP